MTRENQLGEMNNQNVDIMEDRDQQEVVQITVMLPNTGTTKGKRPLQQRDHYIKSGRWKQVSQQDPVEEEEIVQINNEEIDHQAQSRISKRRKQVSQPIMTRENQLGEMGNQNVDIMEDRDQQEVVQITDEYQHSYGQASYQRSRQGSAIAYEDSVIRRKSTEDTMLTAWFQANKTYPEARGLTYTEFPTKFVWHDDKKYWAPRKRYEMIGRITNVPPTAGELYFMRMLLNIQKGCHDFNSIKTINGIIYPSYQEACQALGEMAVTHFSLYDHFLTAA
ncbi:uncharacterized protein LOC121048948 [Rosa chinensis]|uniref:uncharacterized protein LOC121048948 n=1 Tax=Rosa chinensis TaxID=74649 RepID=UPI001AD8EAEB|nr:uncharacterized protein LOC121048948 [Rosa chinensis]